jgi:adhesin transport system outer membrane protein
VIEAYLNWTRTEELIRLAQKNLLAHQRLLNDVVKIARVDVGRQIDVEQAEVRYETAQLSLRQRESEHEIISQRLRRMLLGSLPSRPEGYENIKGVLPANPEQALAAINDVHPVVAQRLAEIEAAKAQVSSARAGFSPTVDLSYQKQTTQGTGQGDYVTQLNLRVPIFDGGAAYGSTRSAMSQLEAANQGLTEARITLRELVLSSWSELSSAKSRAALGQRQVKTARKLVTGYDQQFRVGRRSLLDLLTIQDNLYSYETQATNARFEELISRARIQAIINRLATAYQTSSTSQDSKIAGRADPIDSPRYRIQNAEPGN